MVKVGNAGQIEHKYIAGFVFQLEGVELTIVTAYNFHPDTNLPVYTIQQVLRTQDGFNIGFLSNANNFNVTEDFIDECIRRSDLETLI